MTFGRGIAVTDLEGNADEAANLRRLGVRAQVRRCDVIDEVARTGDRVVITKNGKAVAEFVPHRLPRRSIRGILKDELFIVGDIISPRDVEWDAAK
jgi:ABC-type Na+ transport system ATPase subunit NatA